MKGKTRKEMRKEFRKARKARKHEYFCRKKSNNFKQGKKNFQPKQNLKVPVKEQWKGSPVKEKESYNLPQKNYTSTQERQEYEFKKEKRQKENLERQIREQRNKQLKEDNLKEELEIKKLEKQLKMRNGKSKLFAIDGLDYLLDVCDKKLSDNKFEKTFDDSGSDFENDLDDIVGRPQSASSKIRKREEKGVQRKDEESEEEEVEEDEASDQEEEESLGNESIDDEGSEEGLDEFDEEEEEGLDDLSEEEGLGMSSEDESDNKQSAKQKRKSSDDSKKVKNKKVKLERDDDEEEKDEVVENKPQKSKKVSKMWEDIYGRTRDEQGNVVKTYVPPQLRQKGEESGDKNSVKLQRLKKELKGLLNRLAESNMVYISNQIEQKYMSNSRNDMNETLYTLFYDSLFAEVLTPERLIIEHAMLVTVLHLNIGSEIGAYFLQHTVIEFNNLLQTNPPVEDKKIDNILLFITHLYNFQIFHSKLIYGMINELLKNLEEKQIDLLVTTLRTVGFSLRKDDPVALKALVIDVQKKANSISTGENSFRVKFMLEMLMAIKNNNVSKIPNYNPEFVEKLRKNLKLIVRKGNFSTELNISFQDLLNAEKQGRWWIVGSAWSNSSSTQPESEKSKEYECSSEMKFSQKLLDLAKQQRMNTDIRRDIFCILMSAEDYLDAFERLIRLKLKGVVEREIINILLHCVMQEQEFNPYYVCLANKFCLFDRKYQVMLQCSIWDKIKELGKVLPVQITNFAKFVGNVILKKGLPISILKVIQFSDLDKPTIKFMRQLVLTILLDEDRSSVAAVFNRIADSNKLKLFKESLRLFLQHFIVKKTKNIEEEKASRLMEMVKVADHALKYSDAQITF